MSAIWFHFTSSRHHKNLYLQKLVAGTSNTQKNTLWFFFVYNLALYVLHWPRLGPAKGVGASARIESGSAFHAAEVAAVVGLCQTEAAQDLSTSLQGTAERRYESSRHWLHSTVAFWCGSDSLVIVCGCQVSPSLGRYFSLCSSVP